MSYILVTGGLGFIGSHVTVELLQNGYRVLIIDNLYNSKYETYKKIVSLVTAEQQQNCEIAIVDILNQSAIENIFITFNIQLVIHLAGLKSMSESMKCPDLYYDVNVNGTKILLNVMEKYGCSSFIYSSSATVYSPHNPMPLTESMSSIGIELPSVYAQTKYEAEMYIRQHTKNISYIILRYFNPIGAHSSGIIGEDFTCGSTNLFPVLLNLLDQNKHTCTIYGSDYNTPDGTCQRDFIHIEDLAHAHLLSLQKLWNRSCECKEVYNVGTGHPISVFELITAFNTMLTKEEKLSITYTDRRIGDVPVCFANVDKIYQHLKWKAKHNLETMCKDGLFFYRRQKHRINNKAV